MAAVLSDNIFFKEYIAELEKRIKSSDVLTIRLLADKSYKHLEERFEEEPEAKRKVFEKALFPTLVMYRSIMESFPDIAMEVIKVGSERAAKQSGANAIKLSKVPGAKTLFMNKLGHDVKKYYGPEAGFNSQLLSSMGNYVQFEVKECPIIQFCTEYGYPELASIFCMIESYEYSSLEGVGFLRNHSLELDGEKCDFRFEHVRNR